MKLKYLSAALFACALMFSAGHSVAAEKAAPVAPDDLMLAIRAKNDAPTKAAAARLQASADAGNSYAMYNIGSLHRQTSRKGAAVFAYDPGKSLKWLTRAFSGGRVTAAYKIALIYMSIGDDMEAMGWAQVYSHFVRPNERSAGQQQLRLALINDLYERVGRNSEDAIDARKMTLLDRHGRDFEDSRKRAEAQHPDWVERGERCERNNASDEMPANLKLPGHSLIENLVKVKANGSVEEFASLDSAPVTVSEKDLRPLVARLACPPANQPARYLIQFVQMREPTALEFPAD